jgi:hypothetical protein
MGSKLGDNGDKTPSWEMPVRQDGASLGQLLNAAALCRAGLRFSPSGPRGIGGAILVNQRFYQT